MWKREEAVRPVKPAPVNVTGAAVGDSLAEGRLVDRQVVNIGKSVVIKGELSGSEDLTLEGQVDGKIELKQHVLTIGPHGRVRAQIFAKAVVVLGEVVGNIKAVEKVAIGDTGSVEGDIDAPKVAIAEGARFRGGIDMQQGARTEGEKKPESEARPQGQASPERQATASAKVPVPAVAGSN